MITSPPTLDPWLSMWVRPRATVRQIFERDPNRQVFLLAAINGIITSFNNASARSLGDRLPFVAVLSVCVVFGALGGILSLAISSAVLGWMGRKLGGHGQAQDVRAALAWAAVPTIWSGTLLIPELILFGEEMFTTATPRLESNPVLALVLLGLGGIQLVIGLWGAVVYLKSLGEAHGFSAWRALGTVLLSSLLLLAPIICIVVGIGVLTLLGTRV